MLKDGAVEDRAVEDGAAEDRAVEDSLTDLEGRKPSRSGLGKPVLPDADILGKEHMRAGDNQVGSHGSASISTPAGQVGSACEALSAKDGVEAGSSPVLLGTSAVQGREHARTLREQFRPIYGLVNNAGVGTAGILATMSYEQIAEIIQINTLAPITLTKYLIRSMLAAHAGRVVNIASVVANTGYAGLSVYSASKAALIGFTRALAREVGSLDITVNAVAPGFIDTEMTHGLNLQQRQQIIRRSAMGRMATISDVAAMVVFLMSASARNITGTVVTVDAGNTV